MRGWCAILSLLLGGRLVHAETGVSPLIIKNGQTTFVAASTDQSVPMYDATGGNVVYVAMSTADFTVDDGTDICTLDPSVTQLGAYIGEVGDFTPYASGGINFTTTTSCPAADCDASGEAGRWCPNTTEDVLRFCKGTSGWMYVGDVRSIAAITASSTAITSTADTAFSNGSFTVPNSQPVAGTSYNIHASGIYSTTSGTQSTTLTLKFGSTIIWLVASPTLTASMTNAGWVCEWLLTWRAVTDGAATMVTSGMCDFMGASNWPSATMGGTTNGAITGMDTVGQDGTIQLYNDWTNASNSITLQQWQVEQRK